VLTAGWQTLVLWDVATGQIVRTFHGHSSYIMDVRVSPDARTAVSAERDNVFIRWRLDTTNPVRVIPPNMQAVDQLVPQCQLHAVSLGADGNVAFCSYDNRDAVRHRKEEGRSVLALWNLETGEPLAVNPGRSPCCNAVHLDADRQVSLTGDALDGRIMLWDLSTGQVVRDMTADTNSEYKVNSISAVLLSADGRHILSSANQVVVW